jgi:trehalose 6-phosphate synthase/phosphatase
MKLVIISNRLPVTIREQKGELHFAPSSGGLVTGLRSYLLSPRAPLRLPHIWVGWPGAPIRPELQAEVIRRCQEEFSGWPVFLSQEDSDAFYEGFCNKTLWPLFHYFPSLVSYEEKAWSVYQSVNRLFRDAVLDMIDEGDLIWVHDYHLLLLPALLKEQRPEAHIGFFLHIPFPSYEIFRLLPDAWRSSLLQGLLGADLVGFHTHDYSQYFLKAVRRILGYEHEMGLLVVGNRVIKADTFPMGVDFEMFDTKARDTTVVQRRDELRQTLAGARVVLSIDRLDYAKGLADRLLAFRAFLEANPGWHGKAVLLMLVVPSRTGVEEYQRMKQQIDELVGNINGRFGTLTWTPVIYQFRSLPQEELIPLYAASDVMLVTPLRDGMNLVAKEYPACRSDETGVLLLSELAGAASELGEAVIVNPNDISGMAQAIKTALEMPREAQKRTMKAMRDRLRRYDVVRWAGEFLKTLQESHSRLEQRFLSPTMQEKLISDFRSAGRRLLLCDYDGTLVPIRPTPGEADPDINLMALLGDLTQISDLVLVSGRSRATLDSWFGHLYVGLVAEHGSWVKESGGEWTSTAVLREDWKLRIRNLMELYAGRLPRSWVEEKEFTLAWHFRQADPDLAALRTRELADHLIGLTEMSDLKIVEGHKVIEVKPSGASKGAACQTLLTKGYDFVLAIGDDATDEELFRVLPESAYSIRVGLTSSYARFNIYDQAQVRKLLDDLAAMRSDTRDETRTTSAPLAGSGNFSSSSRLLKS